MFGWFRKKASHDDDMDVDRAMKFFRRGDYDEALRRAEVMLAAGPRVALSWRFKGECLFYLEAFYEADECFQRAAELGGEGTEDMFLWRALALHNDGITSEARQLIRDFLASGAGSPELIEKAHAALAKLEGFDDVRGALR
jgi:tetratricopeptide (TPR) repeat protein